MTAITMKQKTLREIHRKAKVNYPWIPPLQLRMPSDFLVMSRCSPSHLKALEEIREGLNLMGSPAYATMRLMHVPGGGGESDRQVSIYCRFRGWQTTMKASGLDKQRECTEQYAQGNSLRIIEQSSRVKNGKARFHISKGLEEYSNMFLLD